MKILKPSARGPAVELLQLALERAGFSPGAIDGQFGPATTSALVSFQKANGLVPDGIAGPKSWDALSPFLLGYRRQRLVPGDSLWRLSQTQGISLAAIEAANPGLDPFNLIPGTWITLPLPFPLVPENVSCTSLLLDFCVQGLLVRYPFLKSGQVGKSLMGKPLHLLRFGQGPRHVFYSAAHHGNEWITSSLLLLFIERLCAAYVEAESIGGIPAEKLFEEASIFFVPMVNPDGVDLATGLLDAGPYYERALSFAKQYPSIAFPTGWKANLNGVDLNLQYPAGWEQAREIKAAQGYTRPGPRDYVGTGPLTEPESRALAAFTRNHDFDLILAYHSQGQVIYWKFLDMEPPGARELADLFAQLSGYTVEDTPYASSFAGYKDWFIQDYNRPGFTIEVGLGENPLPISQLPQIYRDNVGILAQAPGVQP